VSNGSPYTTDGYDSTVPTGEWIVFAFVMAPSQVRMYENGMLVKSFTHSQNVGGTFTATRLGKATSSSLQCDMSHARVYATALDAACVSSATYSLPVTWTTPSSLGDVARGEPTNIAIAGYGAASYALVDGSVAPTGLSLSVSGSLTGSPSAANAYSFTVRAKQQSGVTSDRTFALRVALRPAWTTVAALQSLAQTRACTLTLSATDASATGYSLVLGSVPGMTLSTSGVLSGTPTATGSFTLVARVHSATSTTITADRTFTVPVVAPPAWSTSAAFPDIAKGATFSQQLVATTATTYAVQAGALPSGLTLSSTGVLSGTLTTSAPYSFTVRATNANAQNAYTDRVFTMLVATTPTWTTSSPLQTLAVSTVSALTFNATNAGTAGGYVLAPGSGAVPAGMVMTDDHLGKLMGTPTTIATYSFTVRAYSTSTVQVYADKAFTVAVVALPAWSTSATLPDYGTRVAVTMSFEAPSANTYSLNTGSLPSGLTLSASGALSGTTSNVPGTVTFGIRATITNVQNGYADRTFTLNIVRSSTETWSIAIQDTTADGCANYPGAFALIANQSAFLSSLTNSLSFTWIKSGATGPTVTFSSVQYGVHFGKDIVSYTPSSAPSPQSYTTTTVTLRFS
jgi:large repetitive protein